jgi:peptidoglycan/LPS O-acetylase OafA/YrhL
MSTRTVSGVAAGALALNGVIHLALSPEQLDEKAYLGVLFILGGIASLVLAVAVWRGDRRALVLGAVLSAAIGVGFILSRTTGLPGGFKEEEWEPLGVLTLGLEVIVVAIAARAGARRPVGAGSRSRTGMRAHGA